MEGMLPLNEQMFCGSHLFYHAICIDYVKLIFASNPVMLVTVTVAVCQSLTVDGINVT